MTTKTAFEKLLSNSEFTLHHLNVAIELLKMPDDPLASREHNIEMAIAHLRMVATTLDNLAALYSEQEGEQ
tara:strand:+ start:553 stop:765 length:213 start_codon:yes stop_codon:yes gene_type:complete